MCGNGDRKAILDNVLKLLDGHERIVAITPHQRGEQFEELPVERFETHTRAFIKVEDGCNRQCAYCVIPRARGPVRSRAESSILAELRQLAAAGYREVVLSAISLPSYGLDTGTNLVELVEKCAQVEGIQRIRLGSLDPDMLTPEFITRLAAVDKLCPQFHLSLQSGCTATLRRIRGPSRQLYHRLHLRLPRRDARGFCRELRLPEEDRLFEGACVPLLPPQRHPGLRLPGSGARARKAGAQP